MSNVTLSEIADLCAKEFGVTLEQMRARHSTGGRAPVRSDALLARNTAIWLARRHTSKTLPQLARFFDICDARSVSRALQVAADLVEDNRMFAARVEKIEEEIDRIHEARLDEVMAGGEGRAAL